MQPRLGRSFVARQVERLAVTGTARLRELGSSAVPVELLDLSTLGVRAVVPHNPFRAGMHVVLTLAGIGEINGRVLWAQSDMLGARFCAPVRDDQLLSARAHSPRA